MPVNVFLEIFDAKAHPGDDPDDDPVWDTPLSSHFFLDDDSGPQSLQRFISSAASSFGYELDLVINRNKDILKQAARKYKNSSVDVTRPLNVSFKGGSRFGCWWPHSRIFSAPD